MGKIIFVGSSWIFAKYMSLACQILGYEPVFLGNMNFYSEEVQNSIKQCEYYQVDITSVDVIYDFIKSKKIENIVGVISSADTKLANSISLAKKLNVRHVDEAVILLGDKSSLSQLIPEFTPETIIINKTKVIPKESIVKLLKKHKRLVLKPTKGSGAAGVKKISQVQDLDNLQNYMNEVSSDEWIIQQAIEGELYSIEGYCVDGEINILGFSLRDRINLTEMTNHFPVEGHFKKKIKEKSIEALKLLVLRSKFKNGYFHCEFLSDGKSVYLIDPNFGRIGGMSILEQVAFSIDTRPEYIVAHIINLSLFNKDEKLFSFNMDKRKSTLSASFGIGQDATFMEVINTENIKSDYYTLVANEGSPIKAIGSDDYSWIGCFAGSVDSVMHDLNCLNIKTTDKIFKANYFVRDLSNKISVLEIR